MRFRAATRAAEAHPSAIDTFGWPGLSERSRVGSRRERPHLRADDPQSPEQGMRSSERDPASRPRDAPSARGADRLGRGPLASELEAFALDYFSIHAPHIHRCCQNHCA